MTAPSSPVPLRARDCRLRIALALGSALKVREVLQSQPELAHGRDALQRTPLLQACTQPIMECVEALLPFSDVQAADSTGCTPLMMCARRGDLKALLAVLPGSDPLACDHHGETALMMAARHHHIDCLRVLVPLGGVHLRNHNGQGALALASGEVCDGEGAGVSVFNPTQLLGLLGDAFADAKQGDEACVRLLLQSGATDRSDRFGERAFDVALRTQSWACADWLASSSAALAKQLCECAPPIVPLPRSRALVEREQILQALPRHGATPASGSASSDASHNALPPDAAAGGATLHDSRSPAVRPTLRL